MSFNWPDLIVTFGILQGIICAILLARHKPVEISRKLLICMLLVFSVLSLKVEIRSLLWDHVAVRYLPIGMNLLIQPLLYLYVCSLTKPDFRLRPLSWLHFLPSFLFLAHAVVVYISVLPIDLLAAKDVKAEEWHYRTVKDFQDYLSVISTCVYGYLSLRNVNRYRKWLNQNISDTSYLNLKWIKNMLIVTGFLVLGLCLNIVLDYTPHAGRPFFHWQLFYIYLSIGIYYISIKGYLTNRQLVSPVQEKLFFQQRADDQGGLEQAYPKHDGAVQNRLVLNTLAITAKYSDKELAAARIAIMEVIIIEQIFLDSELTLEKLASAIGLSPELVSAAINHKIGKSFRTLINDFRVEEVKLKLLDVKNAHLSILEIALECGFNSEASFHQIFKSTTGQSPKEYADRIKANNGSEL